MYPYKAKVTIRYTSGQSSFYTHNDADWFEESLKKEWVRIDSDKSSTWLKSSSIFFLDYELITEKDA